MYIKPVKMITCDKSFRIIKSFSLYEYISHIPNESKKTIKYTKQVYQPCNLLLFIITINMIFMNIHYMKTRKRT